MPIVDIIFLIILGGFILSGFWFGLIHTLGSLLGTLFGIYLTSRWYDDVALWASDKFGGSLNIWNVIVFIILFVVINRLIGFVFHLLERGFDIITSLPFLKTINRFAGAFLGLVEGAVVIGAFIFIAGKFPFDLEEKFIVTSELKTYFSAVFNVLLPLVPEALKRADKLIP